jgi:hypothetical protein
VKRDFCPSYKQIFQKERKEREKIKREGRKEARET